jgi:hypothetical protein
VTATPTVSSATSRSVTPVTQAVTSATTTASATLVEETETDSDVPNVTGARTTSSSSSRRTSMSSSTYSKYLGSESLRRY